MFKICRIEADHSQLRAVVGGGQADGLSDAVFPVSGEPRGFVDVSMEGEEGLSFFNKLPDGHAADMTAGYAVEGRLEGG